MEEDSLSFSLSADSDDAELLASSESELDEDSCSEPDPRSCSWSLVKRVQAARPNDILYGCLDGSNSASSASAAALIVNPLY